MGKQKLSGSAGLNTMIIPKVCLWLQGTAVLQKVTWAPESTSLDTSVGYLNPEEGTIFQIHCQVDLVAAMVTTESSSLKFQRKI